jgi:hypothetical protein
MRYARIVNGTVINVEVWGEQPPAAEGVVFVELADDSPVGPGHAFDGENFTAPEPEPVVVPVPEFVGPAQIRLVLASQGITEAVITQMIDALPAEQRSNARILWDYSSQFYRNNPFVVQVGAAMGLTSDQIDDMFRVAITL